eukprot:4688523-Pyramimonas_sp.AAC.1
MEDPLLVCELLRPTVVEACPVVWHSCYGLAVYFERRMPCLKLAIWGRIILPPPAPFILFSSWVRSAVQPPSPPGSSRWGLAAREGPEVALHLVEFRQRSATSLSRLARSPCRSCQ